MVQGPGHDREVLVSYFLDQARKHYNFNHLVIGHSAAGEGIRMRGKGKVIMIDVGISRCYGGPADVWSLKRENITGSPLIKNSDLSICSQTSESREQVD